MKDNINTLDKLLMPLHTTGVAAMTTNDGALYTASVFVGNPTLLTGEIVLGAVILYDACYLLLEKFSPKIDKLIDTFEQYTGI